MEDLAVATTTVREFLVHKSPSKCRVYALRRGGIDTLELVTTLGGGHLQHTDELLAELNDFLLTRNDERLTAVCGRLPDAVQIAVRTFVDTQCAAELGEFSPWAPIDPVREMYFDDQTPDFEDMLSAAYLVGLGIRVSNNLDEDGEIEWTVELFDSNAVVAADAEPRTWALPTGVRLDHTWTSQQMAGDPVVNAVAEARRASAAGHWVRLHSIEHDDPDNPGTSTDELVVDIFDAPIPASEEK
jgi:hypothetical protein